MRRRGRHRRGNMIRRRSSVGAIIIIFAHNGSERQDGISAVVVDTVCWPGNCIGHGRRRRHLHLECRGGWTIVRSRGRVTIIAQVARQLFLQSTIIASSASQCQRRYIHCGQRGKRNAALAMNLVRLQNKLQLLLLLL